MKQRELHYQTAKGSLVKASERVRKREGGREGEKRERERERERERGRGEGERERG